MTLVRSETHGAVTQETHDDRPVWLVVSTEFVKTSVNNLPKLALWSVESAVVCAVAVNGDSNSAFLTATALEALNLGLALKQFKDRRKSEVEIEENFLSTILDVFAPMALMGLGLSLGSNPWFQENVNSAIGWIGSELTKYSETHGGVGGHRGISINEIPKGEQPMVPPLPDVSMVDGAVNITTNLEIPLSSDTWGDLANYSLKLLNKTTGGNWPYLIPSAMATAIIYRSWFGNKNEN